MNALFSIFLETFNDPIGHQPVPPAAMGHYQGKLPNQLLTYWKDQSPAAQGRRAYDFAFPAK
ncbi:MULTISPECIES: GAD-like domain-containing protein [Pseudomonas]|jgi:GAD-like domain|uniref:GAD-like domain-containing protein n=1 Tax=Pseudomonas TaxID=286 RepID=UPI0020C385EF|nr:GAD-like domain-containing protein [Pseudomonas fluorescens]UTL92868.1 hypothetical protein NLL86_09075 [Pseudomonas fluorescens]